MSWIDDKNVRKFVTKGVYMCIICAAIPATAAVGARLNADQLHKPAEERRPIGKITGIAIAVLVAASVLYHTLIWRN
jgi:hypothetical protein